MKNKRNKLLAFSIILSMLFAMAVVPAQAAIVDSGTCGDNLIWTLDDEGMLIISGTGTMTDYKYETPWFKYLSTSWEVKSVIIENGVTSIGDDAFYLCTLLERITIPDSVVSIGNRAFGQCFDLKSITIHSGVTSIGDWAFGECFSLESINVSEQNQYYSSSDGVLYNKNKTTLIKFPEGKEGSYNIPDSVTSIADGAFFNCMGLRSITIPDSVTSIGNEAFEFCNDVTDIYYGGTEEDWNKISIGTYHYPLINATKHYNCIFANKLTAPHNNNGETVTLPEGNILDTGANLNFRNGYVDVANGYVKAGDKKIKGSNIYFNNEGKIRLQDGDTAKIEKDNGNGSTDQGFMAGLFNPTGIIKMVLEVTGTANEVDYTGRTITNDFDFTNSEINGLANFGFTVKNIPKPLELSIKIIN